MKTLLSNINMAWWYVVALCCMSASLHPGRVLRVDIGVNLDIIIPCPDMQSYNCIFAAVLNFYEKYNLKQHGSVHQRGRYPCSKCDKSYGVLFVHSQEEITQAKIYSEEKQDQW